MSKSKMVLVLAIQVVVLALMPFVVMSITGCDKTVTTVVIENKPIIIKTLTLAGKLGSYEGLKRWGKNDEPAAKEAAAALSRNLKDVIIPYFNGADIKTSSEINEFVNSSLFKDVPDEVKFAITAAAEVLDFYLPIPGSDKLNADQRDYIKAFLTGLQSGVDKYISSSSDKDVRNWIKG